MSIASNPQVSVLSVRSAHSVHLILPHMYFNMTLCHACAQQLWELLKKDN